MSQGQSAFGYLSGRRTYWREVEAAAQPLSRQAGLKPAAGPPLPRKDHRPHNPPG